MFDQSNGLRFDIYERIHLPQELPGIAELEEVELLPEIRVIQREDRAELYGQLLLTGLYRSEDDLTQRLEHAIPVEITVPLTRVNALDDISVDIENFDIDLLSMRSVNITGVLSLKGVGSAEAPPAWQQEEYTVAYSPAEEWQLRHESGSGDEDEVREVDVPAGAAGDTVLAAEDDNQTEAWAVSSAQADGGTGPETLESIAVEAVSEEEEGVLGVAAFAGGTEEADIRVQAGKNKGNDGAWAILEQEASDAGDGQNFDAGDGQASDAGSRTQSWSWPAAGHTPSFEDDFSQGFDEKDFIPAGEDEEQQAWTSASVQSGIRAEEQPPSAEEAPEAGLAAISEPETVAGHEPAEQHEGPLLAAAETAEEKADLKIAFGSKEESLSGEPGPLTFSSLLKSSRSQREREDQLVQPEAYEEPEAAPGSADSNWKSRLISRSEGASSFRKVRLCIVQREETLDAIAEKYQLSSRELLLYNRLAGQSVEEGQVLYIP